MREITSARRKRQHSDSTADAVGKDVPKAMQEENQRKEKKEKIRKNLQECSWSYNILESIKKWMDTYHLDGILGLIPGVGDTINQTLSIPFIYVALFKVRSIPLTLAVCFNILLDTLIGAIPFFIGDLADFFFRSFKRNYEYIVGFVEDDREVIRKVNKRAVWMAIGMLVISYLIYLLISFTITLTEKVYDWIVSLF